MAIYYRNHAVIVITFILLIVVMALSLLEIVFFNKSDKMVLEVGGGVVNCAEEV